MTRWDVQLEWDRIWVWGRWEGHAVDGNGEWLDIWSWHLGFVALSLGAWRPTKESTEPTVGMLKAGARALQHYQLEGGARDAMAALTVWNAMRAARKEGKG